jgi:hypothetical protein
LAEGTAFMYRHDELSRVVDFLLKYFVDQVILGHLRKEFKHLCARSYLLQNDLPRNIGLLNVPKVQEVSLIHDQDV